MIFISLILVASCCSCEKSTLINTSSKVTVHEIEYDDTISDKTVAKSVKSIADKYFTEELKYNINDYGSARISFDKDREIWIVTYFYGDPQEYCLGGDINIGISEKNMSVISYWCGE